MEIENAAGKAIDLAGPGDLAVPHVITFEAIIRGGFNAYFDEHHDEALRHGWSDARAMMLDEHMMACVFERIRGTSRLKWHLEPDDERDPQQKMVADALSKLVRRTPNFRRYITSLAWAVWWGRAGVQHAFRWDEVAVDDPMSGASVPIKGLAVSKHAQVHGDKIKFRLDGTPLLQVNAAEGTSVKGFEQTYTTRGQALILEGAARERFTLHAVNCFDVDFMDAERADAIHGLGLRHFLYWSWWMKNEAITAVISALDRFGLGFVVVSYDEGNANAKAEAIEVGKKMQGKRSVFVIPRLKGSTSEGAVQVVDGPIAGAQMMLMLSDAWELKQERFIIGQAGSSRSQASGIGNEAASEFMQDTKHQIIEEDAAALAETLTGSHESPGLVSVIKKWTFPWATFPVHFKFDLDPPNVEGKLGAATMIFNMGAKLKESELVGLAGLTTPEGDDKVLQSPAFVQMEMQQQQAAQGVDPNAQGGGDPNQPSGGEQAPAPSAPSGAEPQGSGDPVFDKMYEGQNGQSEGQGDEHEGADTSPEDDAALEEMWHSRAHGGHENNDTDLSPEDEAALEEMWHSRSQA